MELDLVFGSPFSGRDLLTGDFWEEEEGGVGEGGGGEGEGEGGEVERGKRWTESDKEMSRVMMRLWTNFAKYKLVLKR